MDIVPQKTCTKCGQDKPVTEFTFVPSRKNYYSQCKACKALAQAERRLLHPRIRKPRKKPTLPPPNPYCTRCGIVKTPENTHPDSRSRNGLRECCKVCRNKDGAAYMRTRWINDPEGMRARHRQEMALARARDPEKHRNAAKRWRKQHPELAKSRHRQWANSERGRLIRQAHHQKRRAYKAGNGGSYTAQEWQQLKQQYDYYCLCCHRREPDITLTVDHVIPLSWGGANDISNIQPLCLSCNTSKNNRHATDYRLRWVPHGMTQTSLDFG